MRLTDYVILGTLALAGCAEAQKRNIVFHETIEQKFDKPQPKANIKARESLLLTPNSAIGITVEDLAERRKVSAVVMYFKPENGKSIKLDISGSARELQEKGKSHFCWYIGDKILEGPGTFAVYLIGEGEVGVYEEAITIKSYDFRKF